MTKTHSQSDDDRLIAKVRAATRATIDPATVEKAIGQQALVNTDTGLPLEALRRVNLGADPDHAGETLDLDQARTVIYWARPVEARDAHVVGLAIGADGQASVFFAIVYPP